MFVSRQFFYHPKIGDFITLIVFKDHRGWRRMKFIQKVFDGLEFVLLVFLMMEKTVLEALKPSFFHGFWGPTEHLDLNVRYQHGLT